MTLELRGTMLRASWTHVIGFVLCAVLAGCGPGERGDSETNRGGNGGSSESASHRDTPPPVSNASALVVTLGVYQTDKPSVMFKKFTPIADYLSSALSKRLGKDVNVSLEILATYKDGLDAIVDGKVDFVRVGPATYVLAKEQNPDVHLLAMETKKGKLRFSGVIAVRTDSPIETLKDLAGKKFAFGDRNSTIGCFLAKAVLWEADVLSKDLDKFAYLERHDKVARAVELGDYDAGALKMSTFKKLNKEGKLRVLEKFDNVTKPWIARSDLDEETVGALRETLLALTDETVLGSLKVSGFVLATDDEYGFVREGMEKAERFGAGDG